jgi:hypothetical protein
MQGLRIDCGAGATDGSGFLALLTGNVIEPSNASVHFLAPDGTLLSQSPSTNASLTGQLSGFEGQAWAGGPSTEAWRLRLWDSHGATAADGPARAGNQSVAEDPLGGIVVLVRSELAMLENYDQSLNLRWRVSLPARGIGGFAVDRAGRTLLLFDADYMTAPQAVDALWIDHDGNRGPVFRALGKQSYWPHLGIEVTQRVGSGLFFRTDRWFQIDSLATTVQPPPTWFASHQVEGLHMVHGGRGYAVLPPGGQSPDCGQAIEVISPSGTSCGRATFSAGSAACQTGTISVGYDGTVIQQLPRKEGDCTGQGCTCSWQWWSGFFR